MTDREVGELWRAANIALDNGHSALWAKSVIDLIRKLVEKQTEINVLLDTVGKYSLPQCEDMALRDFGIDPEGYK